MKDKEVPSVQDEEDEPEMTKRHLNVVFIGHVGKLMNLTLIISMCYQGFFVLCSALSLQQPWVLCTIELNGYWFDFLSYEFYMLTMDY